MSLTRRTILTLGAAAAAGAALDAALPARGRAQSTALHIRVVHVPVLIFAPLYVAIERGYFTHEGLDVELVSTPGGTSAFVVLASGRAEAVVGGLGAGVFNAAARNLDFKVVGPAHLERPPDSTPLVVSRRAYDAGEIRTVRDLRGKRVSVNVLGSATEFWLNAAMLHGGLTLADVQVTEVNFPDVAPALANGAIAAGLLGEPLTTLAEDRGQIKVLSEDFINNVQVTAVYFGGDFMRRHTDHAIGFMAAWVRACRDLAGPGFRQPEVARIVQKYTGVPADVVVRARRPYYDPNGAMNFNDFVRLEEFFRRRGELTYTQPLPPTAYVDTTFVRRALAIVGPYSGAQ
jgi:NitT/TauT family transport system substrate-binding protein